MARISKYSGSGEPEYEPGSNGMVLRNKRGITDPQEMAEAELEAFALADSALSNSFSEAHRFTAEDICSIHRMIFEGIYDWAGKYRSVEISRDGFVFARAVFLSDLMQEYSSEILKQYTPAHTAEADVLAELLAIVHAEFILIHPFRDGNGRTGRLLISLIAQQAGFAGLDYNVFDEGEKYIEGIHAALDRRYAPLRDLIRNALRK